VSGLSFTGASGYISFASKTAGAGGSDGDLASVTLPLRQVHKGELVLVGTVDRGSGSDSARTWRVQLGEAFMDLPGTIKQPSGQGSVTRPNGQGTVKRPSGQEGAQHPSYQGLQNHNFGHDEHNQKDWTSIIIKSVVGLFVGLLVVLWWLSRHDDGGWARTMKNLRRPGGKESYQLTGSNDDEAVDEGSELLTVT